MIIKNNFLEAILNAAKNWSVYTMNTERKKSMRIKNNVLRVVLNIAITLGIGYILFYFMLPPLNFCAPEFYFFIIMLSAVYMVVATVTSGISVSGHAQSKIKTLFQEFKIPSTIIVIMILIMAVGYVISWNVIRAGSYRDLMEVSDGNFTDDVAEIPFESIPMLDEESASRLGDRKLGELSDMVSQFEVPDNYTQINYKGRPVRVTPLQYGDLIKWFNNRSEGLPAFVMIDMVTQNAEVIRLPEGQGMKYSPFEHFGRNLERHIRFNYPTFMFGEPSFEIDDNQTPYWVCPRIVKRIGLFGGTDIKGAVLVNAITGESEYFEEVPEWVDRLYTASLIIEQYNYHGKYINGFLNSVLGQKNVTVTTSGYNYLALGDDVYVYTGVTSTGNDQSNVGFLLSNQRTKETKYYVASGATENSAMASAEGVVQHLQYRATFPILLNVAGKPTYFMALKDNAALVKMYAMVNVEQYRVVATGYTVEECKNNYIRLLSENNMTEEVPVEYVEKTSNIFDIRSAVVDGNTYYYLKLDDDKYYVVCAKDNEMAVMLNVGDNVTVKFEDLDSPIPTAVEITKN